MARGKKPPRASKATEPPPPPVDLKADLRSKILEEMTKKYVEWTPIETSWLRLRAETPAASTSSILRSLGTAVKKSIGGCFVDKWNRKETTDFDLTEGKFDVAMYTFQLNESPHVLERYHDYADNFKEVLDSLVRSSYPSNGFISFKDLLKRLSSLRLCYRQVTQMSPQLRNYSNLHALVVTANYLTDCPGICLPANLKFLELHGNLLRESVENLAKSGPENLLYIGVGRNYLSKAESLNQMATFEHLAHLGLSENDFDDPGNLFDCIKDIKALKNLSLHGNPISMSISYNDIVARHLPTLETLDGQGLPKNFPADPEQDVYDGCLQVHGLKFMQVPNIRPLATEGKKKPKHFYQLEIELPLLDEELLRIEASPYVDSQTAETRPSSASALAKQVTVGTIDSETMKTASKSRGGEDDDKEEESLVKEDDEKRKIRERMIHSYTRWLTRDKGIKDATKFTSDRLEWSKIMTFKNPCIEVPVKRDWLRQLRDTMRSILTLRLYYKEVIYVPKEKKKDDQTKGDAEAKSPGSTAKRGSVKRGSVKRGSMKRGSVKRGSMKRGSVKRGSMKRGSVKRGSMKRGSVKRGSMKRGSVKRGSMKRGSMKRGSLKRKSIGGSSKSSHKSKDMEEVTITKTLIAKIPVPLEPPVWTERFVGYTWDISSRCLAKKCENVEEIYYKGEESKVLEKLGQKGAKGGGKGTGGTRKSVAGGRKSVAGKRKSVAGGGKRQSTGGKRQSTGGKRQSTGGKRQSTGGKRQSTGGKRKSTGGKRKSTGGKRQSTGGKRKSVAGKRKSVAGGGKRQSVAGGGKRKSVGGTATSASTDAKKLDQKSTDGSVPSLAKYITKMPISGSKGPKVDLPAFPEFLTCHLAVGLKRKNEAISNKSKSGKGGKKSIKRKSMKRQSVKRQSVKRKSMKRKSMKGK